MLADGVTPDPNVANLRPLAGGGRDQLEVRGVGAWDAINAEVIAGRARFAASNCQSRHGGPQWTCGLVTFAPPPDANVQVTAGQVTLQLRQVGTFDPNLPNEVRQNAAAPPGALG